MADAAPSTTDALFEEFMTRIRTGAWPVGGAIPSERKMMEEFGVSRIALREALSRLRALGVLEVSHGRSSRVRKLDMGVLGRLFPLLLSSEAQSSYQHVFQVRLPIESQTAYLAALNRTDEDLAEIEALLAKLKKRKPRGGASIIKRDLDLHLQIARASKNPLFPLLLEALSQFVVSSQESSCGDDPERLAMAHRDHLAIADAIRDRDPERARAAMVAHLHASASRVLRG